MGDLPSVAFPFMTALAAKFHLNETCPQQYLFCPFVNLSAHLLTYVRLHAILPEITSRLEELTADMLGKRAAPPPGGAPAQPPPSLFLAQRELARELANELRRLSLFETHPASCQSLSLDQLPDELMWLADRYLDAATKRQEQFQLQQGEQPRLEELLRNLRVLKEQIDEIPDLPRHAEEIYSNRLAADRFEHTTKGMFKTMLCEQVHEIVKGSMMWSPVFCDSIQRMASM